MGGHLERVFFGTEKVTVLFFFPFFGSLISSLILCPSFPGRRVSEKFGLLSVCWCLILICLVISAFAHIPTLRKGGPTSVFVLD